MTYYEYIYYNYIRYIHKTMYNTNMQVIINITNI